MSKKTAFGLAVVAAIAVMALNEVFAKNGLPNIGSIPSFRGNS